jgi:hypothetical protein
MKKTIVIVLCLLSTYVLISQESLIKFNTYEPKYVPKHDIEATRSMMEAQYQRNLREAEAARQRSITKMNQTISRYNSANKYPNYIINGWHRVTSMNNYDFCDERLVYVVNNKITKYYIDRESRTVIFSTTIYKAKSNIRLKYTDGSTSEILDIYFIESILDPSSKAGSPY